MSNTLKSKISVIILITLLLTTLASTMCFATEATEPEETQEQVEVKLNRKVYFEGTTYKYHSGRLGDKKRKEYKEGEIGCGIISIISKSKKAKYPIYITGEGWISKDQIISLEKYITINFDVEDLKNGLKSSLKINGEFVNVESSNTGIISYNNRELVLGANGTTIIKFINKEGKEIEALATVYNGELELNLLEGAVAIDGQATADIADKKVNVSAEGNGNLALNFDGNAIGIEADGDAKVKATYEDEEILDSEFTAEGSASASLQGVKAEGNASQALSILSIFKAKLSERANATIDVTHTEVGVGGDAEVNDVEVGSADASVEYEYATDEGTANLDASVLGTNIPTKPATFSIVKTIKSLFESLRK